jgi:hypothetical protein
MLPSVKISRKHLLGSIQYLLTRIAITNINYVHSGISAKFILEMFIIQIKTVISSSTLQYAEDNEIIDMYVRLTMVRFQVLTAASMKMSSGLLRRVVW